MSDVALIYQPVVEAARPLAERTSDLVAQRGFRPVIISSWDLETTSPPADLHLAITFGGDGTILRSARWLSSTSTPVVGVQMGRLGFLAELQPGEMPGAVLPYLEGEYWVDQRAMLQAEVHPSPGSMVASTADEHSTPVYLGLNDIVAGRGQSLRTVSVDVSMDGHLLHRFRCDGVIVASPTGSTAYSFAAGGPILTPDVAGMTVTAICPHISTVRSLVLPADSALRLQIWTDDPAVLTVDGQIDHVLADGDIVETRRSTCSTTFARRGSRGEFYSRILAKLG